MRKLRVTIIDDEKNVIEILSTILDKFCTNIEIVGTADNAISGIALINKLVPDLAFIDIEMPDASGFEVVNSITNKEILTVFVTAYENYAVRAFKANVIDYILKPINIEEIQNVVKKAQEIITERSKTAGKTEHGVQVDRIPVSANEGVVFIEPEAISYIEADGRYSKIYFANNKQLFVTKSLAEFEEILDPKTFFRAHNSAIVNLQQVHALNTKSGCFVVMDGNIEVPLSRRKKEEFLKLFVN